MQKAVHAGGTQSDFLIVIPTTIWGSVLPREAISEFPIAIFPAETDMGFMQSEQRLHRKSNGFTEIQSSRIMKDGILASGLAAGSRIEHNRVSTSAANGILVKCIDKSVVDGNYSFKNKAKRNSSAEM